MNREYICTLNSKLLKEIKIILIVIKKLKRNGETGFINKMKKTCSMSREGLECC